MRTKQRVRADFIISEFKSADRSGRAIEECCGEIKKATVKKYGNCHGCLLLAVYGLYKNGLIVGTQRKLSMKLDTIGLNGKKSTCICHALDAVALLGKDESHTASQLKGRLGGEGSIYSFVVAYYSRGLIKR